MSGSHRSDERSPSGRGKPPVRPRLFVSNAVSAFGIAGPFMPLLRYA
jgi:hypothetical protein